MAHQHSQFQCVALRSAAASLFPSNIWIETAPIQDLPSIFPEEAALMARAVRKRRAEFLTGRSLMHTGLSFLGFEANPVLRAPSGSPTWPQGVTGSITHCDHCCAVAIARSSEVLALGLDIECGEISGPELTSMICNESERLQLRGGTASELNLKLFYSAKEAVYKALHPIVHRFLDFHEIHVRVEHSLQTFFVDVEADGVDDRLRKLIGRFAIVGNHVAAGVAIF